MIYFLRDCVYKSRRLRGIFVQHSVKCVCVAQSASAGWKQETFLVASKEGEFPTQLIKCLKMLRQAFFFLLNQTLKQMKKGGTLRKSHPVFAAGSNFTSSITGSRAAPPFSLSFLLITSIHTFICPTSRPIGKSAVHQLMEIMWEFALLQSPTSCSPFPPQQHPQTSASL